MLRACALRGPTGAREVGKEVLMAETVRSPFDYREPPTLDSDGDGSKPPPPRGRVCGRKRKGTPVKVCDRAYVTEDEEEESMSEHSYSPGGDGGGRLAQTPEEKLSDDFPHSVPELGEEGASGVRGPVLFHPPPNCRIREVHCGTQVRLVVIAIRDIAKGEEITVDYSLTDWGENAMVRWGCRGLPGNSCRKQKCSCAIQEEEAGPHPLSLSVSDYLTPSWSLSPSSSPLTHSEPSDSDREEDEEEEDEDDDDDDEEEEMEEMRGRMLRRRKKRKMPTVVNSKKKGAPSSARGPGRPCSSSFSRPAPSASSARSQAAGAPVPPTTNINNNININIRGSGASQVSRRQHCPYCGRHYRSLARHLEKHHANQPEVRTAMELAHMHTHNATNGGAAHSRASSSASAASATHGHSFAVPQPSPSNTTPPTLFSRERESPATRSSAGGVSFSLSLSPPSSTQVINAKKGLSPPLTSAKCPARAKSPSPPPPPSTPRRGRRMKKEKQEEQQAAAEGRGGELEKPGGAGSSADSGTRRGPGRGAGAERRRRRGRGGREEQRHSQVWSWVDEKQLSLPSK
uniref:Si:cabz01080528.1 n=1 Tax=Tetraodon nigroviridis TaxID=99883 RepID=H3CDP6_TETNG